MDNITMIAAIGKNNELGKNNDLIWKLKGDMKFFKENTIGKPIVMGINTFNSLPKLLNDRQHVVLTHQNINIDNVLVYHNLYDILKYINSLDDEVMIIGGSSIYKQFIDYANKMLLTEVDQVDKEANVYFPTFNKVDWESTILNENSENDINYKHVKYVRKLTK